VCLISNDTKSCDLTMSTKMQDSWIY